MTLHCMAAPAFLEDSGSIKTSIEVHSVGCYLLQFPKWITLAFALHCRSSVTISSHMPEKQAVYYTSQCTLHGHVSVDVVWIALASRH